MNTAAVLERYDATLAVWRERLARHTEATFGAAPQEGWSAAQIFDHVAAVQELCLENAEKCLRGEGARKRIAIGPAIFSRLGSFPPIRIRVRTIPPGLENVYSPRVLSRTEADLSLDAMQLAMHRVAPLLPGSSKTRIRHWAGGWFNAAQWVQSAEMHLRHHLRQLDRLATSR